MPAWFQLCSSVTGNTKSPSLYSSYPMLPWKCRGAQKGRSALYFLIETSDSNLALKVLTPQLWISINMVLWAICTTCLGLVKTPGQLIAVRFLLGLFEGGLFVIIPCCILIKRLMLLYSLVSTSSSVSTTLDRSWASVPPFSSLAQPLPGLLEDFLLMEYVRWKVLVV